MAAPAQATAGAAGMGGGTLEALQQQVEGVNTAIQKVEQELDEVKGILRRDGVQAVYLGMTGERLQGYLQALMEKEKQLRDEKAQLTSGSAAAAPVHAPPGIADFWCALIDAREDDSHCLVLPSGAVFMGEPERGSRILIRQCYRELEASIRDGIAQHGIRRVVITGTPGIGKSCYAFYWLWRLWQEGKTVVYQLGNKYFRFCGDNVQLGTLDDFIRAGYLDVQNDWFLCDPDGNPYSGFAGTTLVFISPCTERYKEFLKGPAATTRYMPVWDLEELSSCRPHLFPGVTAELMEELFGQWGGIPRFVLQYAHDSTQQMQLKRAVQTCLGKVVSKTIAAAGEQGGMTDFSSDKVLHMFTEDYMSVQLQWASQYVLDTICTTQEVTMREQLEVFLKASAGDSTIAAFRGRLFEPYVHRLLVAGGIFEYRALDAPQPQEVRTIRFEPRHRHTFMRLRDVDTVETGIYYVPAAQNLAAADAFAIIGGQLHIVQVTVGAKHPVKKAGIQDILDVVSRGAGAHFASSFVLDFAVPPDRFDEYRSQDLVTKDGSVAKRKMSCQQWVLKVAL